MASMKVNRFGAPAPTGQQRFSPTNAYSQAIPQQAQDYDEIMQGYRNQLGPGTGDQSGILSGYRNLINQNKGPAQEIAYQEAPEMQTAFSNLNELQTTGGLNAQAQQDLRARGTSPIRAIYDQMSKKMDRNRTLGGGYSPSYNASATRMAREGSEAIAGQTSNVNAGIAEMVQKGRLSAAPQYAQLASGKNSLMNNMTVENAQNKTRHAANQGNILSGYQGAVNSGANNAQSALRGMSSLYGTTPALVNTFGNQVMQQGQMQQNAIQQKRQNKLGALNAYAGSRR